MAVVDLPDLSKIRDAVMAYPEATFIIFVTGLGLGWGASWLFARRELRVNRSIIEAINSSDITREEKSTILKHSLPTKGWFKFATQSIALVLLLAMFAAVAIYYTRIPFNPIPYLFSSLPTTNVLLAEKCDGLAKDIRDFVLERSLSAPPFFSPDAPPPSVATGIDPQASLQQSWKRFSEHATYDNQTRTLFINKFGARLVSIDAELRSNGHKPSGHWLWAAEARINETADHLNNYAQRLRDNQTINDPDNRP